MHLLPCKQSECLLYARTGYTPVVSDSAKRLKHLRHSHSLRVGSRQQEDGTTGSAQLSLCGAEGYDKRPVHQCVCIGIK